MSEEELVNEILREFNPLPGFIRGTGGVVPLPPKDQVKDRVLIVHCIFREPTPALEMPELVVWFRTQAAYIQKIVRDNFCGSGINHFELTMRFVERGVDLRVYRCSMIIESRMITGGVSKDKPTWECSDDDFIDNVLSETEPRV